VIDLPGFRDPGRGWAWRVRTSTGSWSSGSPIVQVDVAERSGRRPGHFRPGRPPSNIRPGEGRLQNGEPIHLRQMRFAVAAGNVEIVAGAPRALVDRPLHEALGSLLVSLGLLAAGLATATFVQLRYGLRPVRALRDAVAQVRSGAAPRLPVDQPRELRPLAEEVNALIEQNEAGLEHARSHLSNLAHGLKTPLTTLSLQLARENASPEARALVEQLDERIAHHLRRARSAAPGTGGRARSAVAEVADGLAEALRRIHADRGVMLAVEADPALAVAIDPQDLDEMLGNLLDNACKHAAARVLLSARAEGPNIVIEIADDGAGLTEAEADEALRPGARIDESGPGYGFGLAIVRELVELYGGRLSLARSDALGGLAAHLSLPAAGQASSG
jgi:signal transduction histidine kinase